MRRLVVVVISWVAITVEAEFINTSATMSDRVSLEGVAGTTVAWSVEKLFKMPELLEHTMNLTLESIAPCNVEKKPLLLSPALEFNESAAILDFAVINDTVYYLTKDYLRSFKLSSTTSWESSSLRDILALKNHGLTYIEAILLSTNEVLLIFKSSSYSLSYGLLDSSGRLGRIFATEANFSDFRDTSLITVYKDFIFIPAGAKGLQVYAYNPNAKLLEYKTMIQKANAGANDVRSVAVVEDAATGLWLLVVADYNLGLMTYRFNFVTLETTFLTRHIGFTRPLFVSSALIGSKAKLIILSNLQIGLSTLILAQATAQRAELTIELERLVALDSEAQYGDVLGNYVLVVLKNSLLVSATDREQSSEIMMQATFNLAHAKLLVSPKSNEGLLLYTRGHNLLTGRLYTPLGNLVCKLGSEATVHKLQVTASAYSCPKLEKYLRRPLASCAFVSEISLHVTPTTFSDMLADFRIRLFVILVVLLGIMIIFLIVLIIIIIKYKKAHKRLINYQELDSARKAMANELPKAIPPLAKI